MTDETAPTTSEEPEGPTLVAGNNLGSADTYLLLLLDDDDSPPQRPAPVEDSTLRPEEIPSPEGRPGDEPSGIA